jgi:hypothetical protein
VRTKARPKGIEVAIGAVAVGGHRIPTPRSRERSRKPNHPLGQNREIHGRTRPGLQEGVPPTIVAAVAVVRNGRLTVAFVRRRMN